MTAVVVGWHKRTGNDQAFYWIDGTAGTADIPVSNALSSRALSVNDARIVAGYYAPESSGGNEPHGFVFDIGKQTLTDIGAVVVPQPTTWSDEFRNVSINNAGDVAATREIGAGTDSVSQAFLLRSGKIEAIKPTTGFEETFAAGVSNTGWVVGFQRDKDHIRLRTAGLSGLAARPSTCTTEVLPPGWSAITAVYDVYSSTTDDPLVQIGTVVGKGMYLGVERAFAMQITLQVPEPHTYLMLGLGLLAIGAVRMRRRAPPQG